jgi:hypothetical protein
MPLSPIRLRIDGVIGNPVHNLTWVSLFQYAGVVLGRCVSNLGTIWSLFKQGLPAQLSVHMHTRVLEYCKLRRIVIQILVWKVKTNQYFRTNRGLV